MYGHTGVLGLPAALVCVRETVKFRVCSNNNSKSTYSFVPNVLLPCCLDRLLSFWFKDPPFLFGTLLYPLYPALEPPLAPPDDELSTFMQRKRFVGFKNNAYQSFQAFVSRNW